MRSWDWDFIPMITQQGQITFTTVTGYAKGDGLLLCFLPLHTCGAPSSPDAVSLTMREFESGLLGAARCMRTEGRTSLYLPFCVTGQRRSWEVRTAVWCALAWSQVWKKQVPQGHAREIESCILRARSFNITTHPTTSLLWEALLHFLFAFYSFWYCRAAFRQTVTAHLEAQVRNQRGELILYQRKKCIFSGSRAFRKTWHWRAFPFSAKHWNIRRKEGGQAIS